MKTQQNTTKKVTINAPQPGTTVVQPHHHGDPAASAVTCTRRLFFCYFSFAAKRKVSTRGGAQQRKNRYKMIQNTTKPSLPFRGIGGNNNAVTSPREKTGAVNSKNTTIIKMLKHNKTQQFGYAFVAHHGIFIVK